jgi:hypothetical protein
MLVSPAQKVRLTHPETIPLGQGGETPAPNAPENSACAKASERLAHRDILVPILVRVCAKGAFDRPAGAPKDRGLKESRWQERCFRFFAGAQPGHSGESAHVRGDLRVFREI